MNDLTVFSNERFGRIRTVLIDGVVWFVGKDVAAALGYSNPRKALADHVEKIDKICGVTIRDPMSREQKPTLINESGVYSLIFASKEEVGRELGLSANKVGRLANELGLKTAQYGKFFYDKAKNCNKEVQTFKYNQLAVDALRIFQAAGGGATFL